MIYLYSYFFVPNKLSGVISQCKPFKNMVTSEYLLRQYCRFNLTQEVIDLLNQAVDIDLIYDNGMYFKLAIQNQNSKILEALLNCYTKTKLQKDTEGYQFVLTTMNNMLYEFLIMYDASVEISETIDDYRSENNINDYEVYETPNKNFVIAYRNVLENCTQILNQSLSTPYAKEIKKIVLYEDFPGPYEAYSDFKHLQQDFDKVRQNLQQKIGLIQEEKLSDYAGKLLILERMITRCLEDLNPVLEDIEEEAPYLKDQVTEIQHVMTESAMDKVEPNIPSSGEENSNEGITV